ncbi:MAG TPA: carboxypeptidase-like regulatory domain-containing protein [Thermoanaerobaculia bacterium]|nr:carboxypeptidase-like regulatory domain-containing protein [Thermoanaerobaculia bacterium]
MRRSIDKLRRNIVHAPLASAALVCVLCGNALEARQLPQPQNEGTDTTGSITDRDNTRVGGTVYDASGNPLPEVEIWVANDASPSQRMRTRTRKTGSYLARGLGQLYTERDVYGVVLRLSFELQGHVGVETKVAVEKNALAVLHPILYREGEAMPDGDRLHASLVGVITVSNGKPVREATVRVKSPEDPASSWEAVTGKDGRYELLLWNSPMALELEVTGPGQQVLRREVAFDPPQRRDVVEPATLDLVLGGS